ncbi:MAG: T9SS type A sorting domain-containing protein [Candidatus Cloacimonetes bacterium]|nr:T9SS type A sorting domain-containing protein [Candidatus Cloacimonadota bacterium]
MKRILLLTVLSLLVTSLSAAVIYNNSNSSLDISVINDGGLSIEGDDLYQVIAFPATDVSLEIIESETVLFSAAGNELERSSQLAESRVELAETMVMREMVMHRIRIRMNENINGNQSVIDNLTLRLTANNEMLHFNGVSPAFLPIYEKMADNYQTSYLRNLSVLPSRMLIISHSNLNNLNYFTAWKNERGIATDVVMKSDIGNTTAAIKGYIQNVYETEEFPPDYLLLIGDVNGNFTLPAYYHTTENDVTDHPYTLLAGDDYLPEMIVGRMSIDQQSGFDTIISKVLSYEKTPYMTNPEWFDNILLVAGNYSDLPPTPTTPLTTMRWLQEKAVDYGYDGYTEVYYWPDGGYYDYPGTSEIINAINNGVGVVAYRGWGNAWGWNFPYFHTQNIEELSNGNYLPIMTSIVCNTGDFANTNVDPCFGELWLTAGNASSFKGGVAFVGPSDLHTSTHYNNAIFAGFYQGLLDEGIHSFGSAVLRGKWEIYQSFPNDHVSGGDVEFYYYVYNILGDPSLNIWTRTPESMSCELPSEINLGQNFLDIYVPEINNGMVTARKGDEFIVSDFVRDHQALLYFDAETTGTITVTITAVNHLPLIMEVDVERVGIDPEITDIAAQDEIIAGEEVAIDITLINSGTESSEFIAYLEEQTGMASIQEESLNFGTLAEGESSTATFHMDISGSCPEGSELSLLMTFFDLDSEIKFPLTVSNLVFQVSNVIVNDANGVLEPGETSQITVTVDNISSMGAEGLTASIIPATTALTATIASATLGNVTAGSSGDAVFELSAAPGSFDGRQAAIYLQLEDSTGRLYETSFTITIGIVDNTDPTGPCSAGYYAYDNFDTGYEEAPDYFWQEIDPEEGGNGSVILMTDDQTESIPLPFNFTYFDTEYDSISICSNGWISFETTWQVYFKNWSIPAALGPKAMVSAYWDDLRGFNGGVEPLRLCYYYDETQNYFIIEWNDTYNRADDMSVEKFQIVLYDPVEFPTESGNGVIQVNYHTVNNPDSGSNFSTVGIEDYHHIDGVLYTFADQYPASATTLQNGLAIKFTTEAPDDFTGNDEENLVTGLPVLNNNYPNPFNPETTFSFSITETDEVELKVYNIKGELVKTVVSGNLAKGDYSYIWRGDDDQGRSVASGVYFYQLKNTRLSTTKKCVLMK